jgi:hypothetical protein
VIAVYSHIGNCMNKYFLRLQAQRPQVFRKNIKFHYLCNYCTDYYAAEDSHEVVLIKKKTIQYDGNIDHSITQQSEILEQQVKNRMVRSVYNNKTTRLPIHKEKRERGNQDGKANCNAYAKIFMRVESHDAK